MGIFRFRKDANLDASDQGTNSSRDNSSIETWQFSSESSRRRRLLLIIAGLAFLLWYVPWIPQLEFGPISVTRWTKGQGQISASVGPGTAAWVPILIISRHLQHAVVVAEDSTFYQHFGIDPRQILQSIETNIKLHRYARGGSTITQQVVKVAFLGREKTLLRKSREIVGALMLDLMYDKVAILEWYLNLIEFGDGIYGVKNAAESYFRTKPELLSPAQAIHLALVLPSPNRWSKGLRIKSLTPFGHSRFARIALGMRRQGFLTKDQWEQAMTTGDFGRPIHGYEDLLVVEEEIPETVSANGEPVTGLIDLIDTKESSYNPDATSTIGQPKLPAAAQKLLDVEPSVDEGQAETDVEGEGDTNGAHQQ